jgi:hypothetical protein
MSNETGSFEVHQEEDEIRTGFVLLVGVIAIVIGCIGVFFAEVILEATSGSLRPNVAGPRGEQEAPRAIAGIEQTPIWTSRTGLDQREAQRRALAGWGWADRGKGIARIPVDRAIDLVVQEEARR